MDWYKVLKVGPGASQQEIRKAYRREALLVHPDKTGGSTTEEFAALNAAFTVLSDPTQKSIYDTQFGPGVQVVDSEKRRYFQDKLNEQTKKQYSTLKNREIGTLKSEIPGLMAALANPPQTENGRVFTSIKEAREFIDHNGEKLVVSMPQEYSLEYEQYTLDRLRKLRK